MHVDVLVVGSGQAGVPLATRLAAAGRRVALAERGALGGTCVNTGCTPTKTLVASAAAAHAVRAAGRFGVRAAPPEVDFAAVMRRKDDVVRQWREGVERRLAEAGDRLTLLRGHARFTAPRTLDVGGTAVTADAVILNVGARAAVPALPGLDGVPWLDNASILGLTERPAHLLVLGGGYIGCEFAQLFRRLGSEVTLVGREARLLGREDADVVQPLHDAFRDEGIALWLGADPASVRRGEDGGVVLALRDGREVAGSHLLVATGRRPNTDDLGCDAAGVALTERGAVVADDRYRTTAEGVYAVGDCLGGPQFTHTSWDDGRLLFDLLQGGGRRTRADRIIPYAVFCDPQVARVGVSQEEAERAGTPHEVATMPFGHVARAIETERTAGVLKVILDPATERVLGAAITGAEAGELIHAFVALMAAGAPARALVDAEMIHPTFAEGLQSVLLRLPRYAPG